MNSSSSELSYLLYASNIQHWARNGVFIKPNCHHIVKHLLFFVLLSFLANARAETPTAKIWSGDSAIRRVENCVCYASIDGQNLKPWEISWDDPDKLRKQITRCVCQAEIDISAVENPRRYLVPGTVVK